MGELLNLVGLSTGIALYAMLLIMVVSTGRSRFAGARIDPLLLATAVLGLVWNVCALPVYELSKVGVTGPWALLTAVGFCALGLLPAVAVHTVLRRDREHLTDTLSKGIVGVAYIASGMASVLHVTAWVGGSDVPSPLGMRLLTYTFVALVVPLASVTRGQQSSRRALWAVALSIFAVSALHLSQFHQGEPSWAVELLGHHASLPLALAILYQDFPFALADLFLKRALTLLMVVTVAFVSLVGIGGVALASPVRHPRDIGVLVTLWVATALLYPILRAASTWFVDAVVLRRPDYDALRSQLETTILRHDDVSELMDEVCARVREALGARIVSWHEMVGPPEAADGRSSPTPHGALVEVPVAEPPRYRFDVRGLTAGRRLLSDERTFLEAVAWRLGRRIDALRITAERYQREIREQEMAKLATQAELRALRSQINPHFLFNALTTIGYLIQTSPERALGTLMRLTSLLRSVLRSEGDVTTLGREIELVQAYLDIEAARFEERLRVSIRVPEPLTHLRLPPLLLQPLVENAVKHGIAPERRGGDVTIDGQLDAGQLVLTVHDSGSGAPWSAFRRGRESGGVGLKNIEQRLAVQYGSRASLSLESTPGVGTTAVLRLPAEPHEYRELVAMKAPAGQR